VPTILDILELSIVLNVDEVWEYFIYVLSVLFNDAASH
jgi:hypothetical protein